MMTDTEQFEQFMRNYQNMVFSTAVRLLASEAEAQDVSQEVFLKAYERFADLQHSPTAGGWLKTVTTNLCLNHLSRYRGRWRFFSELFNRETEEEFELEIATGDLVGDEVEEADRRRVLESALQRLPSSQRVPLVLYHFEGKSYEEIAESTGSSLSKVKTDIFRAREALKKKLKLDLAGEEGWEEFSPELATRREERKNRLDIPRLIAPLNFLNGAV
ncbi:MAG: sigma-70 family RNA polymerase sigma factor [Verrucomicrobiota bacterium]|nr:sigma-70 family RNA polymerase sigma factor [Verrucomicrobiota bacterium]